MNNNNTIQFILLFTINTYFIQQVINKIQQCCLYYSLLQSTTFEYCKELLSRTKQYTLHQQWSPPTTFSTCICIKQKYLAVKEQQWTHGLHRYEIHSTINIYMYANKHIINNRKQNSNLVPTIMFCFLLKLDNKTRFSETKYVPVESITKESFLVVFRFQLLRCSTPSQTIETTLLLRFVLANLGLSKISYDLGILNIRWSTGRR